MEANSFWLVAIDESSLSVSLLLKSGNSFTIGAVGPQLQWDQGDEEGFVSAVDRSLSQSAAQASISSDAEPQEIALILPPFWVGPEGRILPDKLKLIGSACKSLDLKPVGFIPDDEAIVEQANTSDGFPSSFILVNLSYDSFVLSLVYLGKIKERIRRNFDGEFNPSLLESALLDLKVDSTLPPQIFVFGPASSDSLLSIKNYAWVGKKDIETFLHFPNVSGYSQEETINLFALSIASQLKISLASSVDSFEKEVIVPDDNTPLYSPEVEESNTVVNDEVDSFQSDYEPPHDSMIEVDPSEFGFVIPDEVENFSTPDFSPKPPEPTPNSDQNEPEFVDPISPHIQPESIEIPQRSRRARTQFSFPKFKIKLPKVSFYSFAILPLLILIPFFLTTANVEIFVTPYNFSKKINVVLDSSASSIDWSKNIIPVEKKEFSVSVNAVVPTTGKKTIGNKSQGEITVFNKQDKSQTLPKGTVMTDTAGKKYELVNALTVAASSSNLDQGIITLGQTKTTIQAADIGPEYNIDKSVQLTIVGFSENQIIAKVNSALSGGTKEEISAVGSEDKKKLEQKINESIAQETNNKIKKDLSSLSGVINGSTRNNRSRIEYSRELGEQANELSASVDASVSVFIFNSDQKATVIKGMLEKEPNFANAVINADDFNFAFKIDNIDADRASGSLTIDGKSLPKVNTPDLISKLSGKSISQAGKIIEKEVSSVYKYQISTNIKFLESINPLPFIKKQIKITLKS